MRTVSLISLILAALAVSSIAAHAGSWCAHYRNGGNNCGFHSFEQCQAASQESADSAPGVSSTGRQIAERLEGAGFKPAPS